LIEIGTIYSSQLFNPMTIDLKTTPVPRLIQISSRILTKINRRLIRAIDQIASLPAQLAWGLSKLSFIEANILYPRYQKALKSHAIQPLHVDDQDKNIVQELERKGICITSLEALGLPNTAAFLKDAQSITVALQDSASCADGDRHEIHASKAQLLSHPAIFCWGLNERLLGIVERYLGLPVAYDGASCFLSVANGKEFGARAWHRDREDRRMVKICIYLSDVDEDSGPFQCLPPELNAKVCHETKHRYQPILDQEMQQFSPSEGDQERIGFSGRAGTVIFVDTARLYHRGKPPTRRPRTAVFFSYFSCRPWHPFFCQRTPIPQQQAHILTQHLSEHQQACASWQKDLPNIAKWIPRSRI
jgi:Phytanoyl-CoA dioxygenase (PhyH)